MRISDWSSDVCSSDLAAPATMLSGLAVKVPAWATAGLPLLGSKTAMISRRPAIAPIGKPPPMILPKAVMSGSSPRWEVGRASWRERVCQYVEISVVAVTLKKKNEQYSSIQNNQLI